MRKEILKADAKVNFMKIWGSTLHHIDDLPYDPFEYYPHTYGVSRKKEVDVKVRPMLPSPEDGELPFLNLAKTEPFAKDASDFLPDL